MKFFFTLIAVTFIFSFKSNAQITKGNWLIGGTASFRSTQYKNNGTSTSTEIVAQLSGNVGYFVIDKLVVGLKPEYGRIGVNNNFGTHNASNQYEMGPFSRYYFLAVDKNVNLFSELSYQYGIVTNSQNSSTVNSNTISGLVGCAIFFNSSTALEFTMGYMSLKNINTPQTINSIIAGIGFQFHLEKND